MTALGIALTEFTVQSTVTIVSIEYAIVAKINTVAINSTRTKTSRPLIKFLYHYLHKRIWNFNLMAVLGKLRFGKFSCFFFIFKTCLLGYSHFINIGKRFFWLLLGVNDNWFIHTWIYMIKKIGISFYLAFFLLFKILIEYIFPNLVYIYLVCSQVLEIFIQVSNEINFLNFFLNKY